MIEGDITTGVNWSWREGVAEKQDLDVGKVAPGASVTKTLVLTHDSDDAVQIRGFYLRPVESLDWFYPFVEGWKESSPQKDLERVLQWAADYGKGISIVQGATTTLFQSGTGSSRRNLIACTLGNNGRVAPGEEITVGFKVESPSELTKSFYTNIEVGISYYRIPGGV